MDQTPDNEPSKSESQASSLSEGNATTVDEVQASLAAEDTRPSGPAYRPPLDISRAVATVFSMLVRCLYSALSPLVVGLSGLALLGQALWWRLVTVLFWRPLPDSTTAVPGVDQQSSIESWIYPVTTMPGVPGTWQQSLIPSTYWELLRPWGQLADSRGVWLAFHLLGAVGTLAIWGLFATMICRLIGLRVIRGAARWKTVWLFARRHWLDSFGSIAIPLVAILVLSVPLMLIGLFLISDWASTLGAVLTVLVGGVSIPMAVVLVGLVLCWPLMFPAIAMEGRDCFESISRGYAYVFQRPFHYLLLAIVAVVLGGALGWLLVALADSAVGLLYWALSWGANLGQENRMSELLNPIAEGEQATASVVTHFSSPVLLFWSGLIYWLVRAAGYSVFWGLSTGVYLLMRHYLDQTPLDAIYVEEKSKLDDLEKALADSSHS